MNRISQNILLNMNV